MGVALTTALLGCTSEGELQRGTFQYHCVLEEDAACSGTIDPTSVPPLIAVGGRFGVSFEPLEGSTAHTITPASTERAVADTGGEVTLLEDGTQALLAVASAGRVTDFLLVNGAEVADLFVSTSPNATPLASIDLQEGVETTLYARPVTGQGETLPGGFVFSWQLDDEGLAMLTPSADSSAEVTIVGQYEGNTQLTLSIEQLEVSFFLKVDP